MNRISIRENHLFFFFLAVFLLSFIALFDTRTMPILRFLDEIVILCLVSYACIKLLTKQYVLKKDDIVILILFLSMFVVGIIGNVIYKYQGVRIVTEDIMRCSRWPLAYFSAKIVFNQLDIKKYGKPIGIVFFTIASITVLIYLVNFIFPLFEGGYMRYGIPSRPLFFEHVTFMSTGMICMLLLLLNFDNIKLNVLSFFFLTFMIVSGARLKQIAVVCIIWVFYLVSKQLNKKVKWWLYALAGAMCVFFFFMRSGFNLGGFIETARGEMYSQGLNIAVDHFPLGSGYGTFGTETSANYVSPLYEMYGLKDINKNFISDTGWAQIFAQFGVIGSIAAIANLIIYYLKTIINDEKKVKEKYLLRLMWLYLAIASFASSLLMGTETLICAVTFAILENGIGKN